MYTCTSSCILDVVSGPYKVRVLLLSWVSYIVVEVYIHAHTHTHRKLVIGGDNITPDTSKTTGDCNEYTFTWLTNGFAPTATGKRNDLRIAFTFENAELATSQQVKFYPVAKSSHLTWGTEVQKIELEARGQPAGGAAGYQNLAPTNVSFK